ncbi:hypothetical protein J4443_02945 [Candidatus Woesearchaeota archaeon]|nr:hypothetical protein [Candidatus Woesearchaeota archaeon]
MKQIEIKIPEKEFTVDVEKRFLHNLIEKSIEKTNGTKNLSTLLIKNNLKRYSQRGLSDRLRKWQKGIHGQMPLDFYKGIGNFIGYDEDTLNKKINGVRIWKSRINLNKFPLILDENWIYVSETIRVEGHLTNKKLVLENSNTELLHKFKTSLKKIGIKEETIKEGLDVKVQIPLNVETKDISLKNLTFKKTIKRFHYRILDLKKGKKKELIFYDKDFRYDRRNTYLITYKDKKIKFEINIPKKDKITHKSSLEDNTYQKVNVSVRLEIHNRTLVEILSQYFEIPKGIKSYDIDIPKSVKHSSKELLKKIIESGIDSESTITKDRVILGSKSKEYLKSFSEILNKFNITSSINSNGEVLLIIGRRNIDKLDKKFSFIKEKHDKIHKITENKVQEKSPRGLSLSLYLKSLSELKVGDWNTITKIVGRTGNSSRMFLKQLLQKRFIEIVKNTRPKGYKITKLGEKYLEKNIIYWRD